MNQQIVNIGNLLKKYLQYFTTKKCPSCGSADIKTVGVHEDHTRTSEYNGMVTQSLTVYYKCRECEDEFPSV